MDDYECESCIHKKVCKTYTPRGCFLECTEYLQKPDPNSESRNSKSIELASSILSCQ